MKTLELLLSEVSEALSSNSVYSEAFLLAFMAIQKELPLTRISLGRIENPTIVRYIASFSEQEGLAPPGALPMTQEQKQLYAQAANDLLIPFELVEKPGQTASSRLYDSVRVVEYTYPYYICRNTQDSLFVNTCCYFFKQNTEITEEILQVLRLISQPFYVFASSWVVFLELESLKQQAEFENKRLRAKMSQRFAKDILGKNGGLKQVWEQVEKVAPLNVSVLISGETGTGKELIAKALHAVSDRADKPFLAINAGAIPPTLVDSELFGHIKGAFTGAITTHPGIFERACGGTLFLDEIAELPLEVQTRFLRVLEERTVTRVGGETSVPVDFRLITATNKDLKKLVSEGFFREDLLYRIQVVKLEIPPLRMRKQDIPLFVQAFLESKAERFGCKVPKVPQEELLRLLRYDWPGNVRELQNVVEEALAFAGNGLLHFWPNAAHNFQKNDKSSTDNLACLEVPYADVCRLYFTNALAKCSGKLSGKGGLTEFSGLPYSTVRSKLDKLNIPYCKKHGTSI